MMLSRRRRLKRPLSELVEYRRARLLQDFDTGGCNAAIICLVSYAGSYET